MELRKLVIKESDSEKTIKLKELYNKRADELADLHENEFKPGMSEEEVETVKLACDKIIAEANDILEVLESEERGKSGSRARGFNPIATFSIGDIDAPGKEEKRGLNATKEKEIRAFQTFVTTGLKGLGATEQRALTTNGAAAVIPKAIQDAMITDHKYSDLLHMANVSDISHRGKLVIPIASSGTAIVHAEGEEIADGTPKLTTLELSGFEIVSLASVSRSVADMAPENFMQKMSDFVAAEVGEKLEDLFINGTGENQPRGLMNLEWNESGDKPNAVGAEDFINVFDIAHGLSLLPQKYARNAVVLMNTETYYRTLCAVGGDGAYTFEMSIASEKILSKPIILSEHVPKQTAFIVDPHENYVNFAAPIQVETSADSGFSKHVIDIKAFATMDAAWNPAACVKVAVTSYNPGSVWNPENQTENETGA